MIGDDPLFALAAFSYPWSGLAGAAKVTDFGDPAVVLPLAIGIASMFALAGWWRGAAAWTTSIGGVLALVLFLKLRFFACDHLLLDDHVKNPSGHTAAAAAIYGGLVTIVARSIWDIRRWVYLCTVAITLPFAIVIGASRLILDLHSIAEVIAGGAIGIGGALLFVALAGPPPSAVRMPRVVIVGLLAIAVLHGLRMPAEAAIHSIATTLGPFWACI